MVESQSFVDLHDCTCVRSNSIHEGIHFNLSCQESEFSHLLSHHIIFCSGLVFLFSFAIILKYFFFGCINKYLKIILGTLTILLSSFGP